VLSIIIPPLATLLIGPLAPKEKEFEVTGRQIGQIGYLIPQGAKWSLVEPRGDSGWRALGPNDLAAKGA